MFKALLLKDFKLIFTHWPRLVFSILLYCILLLSMFIILPEMVVEKQFEYLVYFLSIISFLAQAIFININTDEDYSANIISYYYKLNNGLFTFVAAKFCAISLTFTLHIATLFAILCVFSQLPVAIIILVALALLLYITIINLMLLFANNLMVTENSGYYALIVLPFTIPYIMIAISGAASWQYLVLFLGLILIKIPIVIGLIALALACSRCEG